MTKCDSVISCRLSPTQKAHVVRLVKHNLNKITLAIGDGANDVNMIQEAHIGIGIYGQEGMRAVQASDYAIPEFKALWKLLMVHGRWSYIRISEMILYFFYKNMIFTFPQVVFCFYSGFSGQSIFDDWYISFYNMAFTSVPLVIRAVFDQDIYYKHWKRVDKIGVVRGLKENYPYLYYIGQNGEIFTFSNLIKWIFLGIVFGSGVAWVILECLDSEVISIEGITSDIWVVSITLYTSIIFVMF